MVEEVTRVRLAKPDDADNLPSYTECVRPTSPADLCSNWAVVSWYRVLPTFFLVNTGA